jgi:hypothetical protein
MDMCRPGDAATLCPEGSASTLFQCAERSDSVATISSVSKKAPTVGADYVRGRRRFTSRGARAAR